ncbi:MAG: TraG family conjugative transposon ATPase [Prevotellaceae bacterium]|jgi:conjugation system TraG family ATPase|nr:TraG family conjugative transposon ATPase [Prevotellaceae bacterium]
MYNVLPIATLENRSPILKVENDCIVSKFADITAAFKVTLPELFTLTEEEYEAIHATWTKAIRCLPNFSVLHKQDWFIKENYKAGEVDEQPSFCDAAFMRHVAERPYLNHQCYLFLTKSSPFNMRKTSLYTALSCGRLVPRTQLAEEEVDAYMEAVQQFAAIVNGSSLIGLERLKAEDIVGTKETAGLLDKYFALSLSDERSLSDLQLNPESMVVGSNTLCLHTLGDTDALPAQLSANMKYEKLSTDRSSCHLSYAAPLGLMLPYNHIYNQYIFIGDSAADIRKLQGRAKRMNSLGKFSHENLINAEFIKDYVNFAVSEGLRSVRAHVNVIAWTDRREELQAVKNAVAAQLSTMDCAARHNTVDLPTMFWAGIPGNAADFPSEDTFHTFIEPAVCLFTQETNYRDSLSPFGIKMVDRFSGKPVHLDISDEPRKKGWIQNRNKFVLGGSGGGKSFFVNHMVRQYYEQGAHIVMIDVGNSYQGQCEMVNRRTGGRDGVYFTYTEENPIAFNPFYTDDNTFGIEKKQSLKALVFTLWKKIASDSNRTEEVAVENAINGYIKKFKTQNLKPNFDGFYEYLRDEYPAQLEKEKVTHEFFNLQNLLYVLSPFYKDGDYGYLLNSDKQLDLLNKRFVVFELDTIKDHPILFPVVTIIIMDAFISKMRKLKGIRKVIIIEEAWKAIASAGMAEFIKYLYKTVRKFFGEAIVVTQEIEDILSSEVVKKTIINNADCQILLDLRKWINRFDEVQSLLGLTNKQKAQVLSINQNNDPTRNYKEVYIDLGGVHTAVYATEVSPEEYYIYTTEELEKVKVMEMAKKMDGNIELAIRELVAEEKERKHR